MQNVTDESKASSTMPTNVPQPTIQTQPTNPTQQLSVEEKPLTDKKGGIKVVISSLLLLGLVIAGIALNWNFFRLLVISLTTKTSQSTSVPKSVAKPTEASNPTVALGTKTLKVIPGQTSPGQYTLPDGETTILFGSNSVPDLVFGRNYSLNDIHNINYLPIKKEISFYNRGYFMTLANQGCKTETRFTDVPEVWVTDCSIQVTSSKEEAPVKKLETLSRVFNTNAPFSGPVTQADNPLIYLSIPKLSLQNFSTPQSSENVSLEAGSMTSYSTSTSWDIQIITSYGVETIRYSAQEIWDKETKQAITGPLTSTSKVDNLDCKVIFTGNEGQKTERCEVAVNLSFSQDSTNLAPIKLATYSQ